MSRRRNRDGDLLEVLTSVALLVAFLFYFVPSFREITITAIVCLVIVAILGLAGWAIFRYARLNMKVSIPRPSKVYNLDTLTTEVIVSPPPPQTTSEKSGQKEKTSHTVDAQYTHYKPESSYRPYTPETPYRSDTPDIKEQFKKIDWFQFEKLIALVYRKLGYTVTRRGGANADGGIDLVIEKDELQTAVQCKHWKAWKVGVKAVREFYGALEDFKFKKGIFITMRGYTLDARQLAQKHGIELLDEADLMELLLSTGAARDPDAQDLLSDTRKYCPKCEREMVLKTSVKGFRVGEQFWGCSGYPKHCRHIMPFDSPKDS